MTISSLCKTDNNICVDNIYDLYGEENLFMQYIYSSLISLIYFVLVLMNVKDYKRLTIMNIFSFILICIMIYIHSEYSHTEMCKFPRWCHEGINDTIIENSYFYRMDKCPKFGSWLLYYYEDIIDYDYNHFSRNHCEESLYGCCGIDNTSCDTVVREGDSYSFYQILLERNTRWFTSIEKIDESGSNCPTIEEIIDKVSSNVIKINLKYEIIMLSLIIIFMDIYLPYKLSIKVETKTIISQNDIEDGNNSDSDDAEENTNQTNGWRFTLRQGNLKKERITMVASA